MFKHSRMELYKILDGWEDESVYADCEDVDDEERVAKKLRRQYGLAMKLREDAPPEVVEAYNELRQMEAYENGSGAVID